MRSRTVREGSVGLLFLLGIGLFTGLVLWLKGAYFGNRTYKAIIEFANAGGMQIGTPVRYRGVKVGRVTNIKPGSNGVDVEIEITQAELAIPRNVVVETNQSGLIGENSIDIMPTSAVPIDIQGIKPYDPNCQDSNLIICNNARLQGEVGISLDQLIRVAVRFANLYSDPKFFANVNSVVENTSTAAQGVTKLTQDLSSLTASLKQNLNNISGAANTVNQTAQKFGGTATKLNQTIDRLAGNTTQTTNKVGKTVDKFGRTADQISVAVNRLNLTANQTANKIGATADQLRLTASQASGLVTNLNSLVTTNKASLVSTLNNLSIASEQLRGTVANLSPAINRVTQGELIRNLETLSANAAQASANIKNLSTSLNNPTNLVVLQQTLDSARVTFQNAQKITSDLDELTGDPTFRNNVKNLVNGLSGLVSSTEQLQQEVEVAQFLAPMVEVAKMELPHAPVSNAPVSVLIPKGEDNQGLQIPESMASKEKEKTSY